MLNEVFEETEMRMSEAIDGLRKVYVGIRTGRANAMVLDNIRVDYYGVPTPINQIAAIKTPDAHMLVIEPWDKGVVKGVEHAILESDLGVTPSSDGSVVRLPFPAPTEERRRDLVKQCKTYAEEARVAVRRVRQDSNAEINRIQKEESLSEDEAKVGLDKVQKITDTYIAKVDEVFKEKEAEVMEV